MWGVLAVSAPHWVCLCSLHVCFPHLHCSGCFAAELSKAGPGLHALPRSKLLSFRFSCTPQRHRLSWVCVFRPSQVQAAQATRILVSTLSQDGSASYHLPGPSPLVSGCAAGVPSQVCHVSRLGSWDSPGDVSRPGSQEDLVSNWESACNLVEGAISGAEIAPCWLWLSPACLPASGWGGGICSVLCSVSRPGSALG